MYLLARNAGLRLICRYVANIFIAIMNHDMHDHLCQSDRYRRASHTLNGARLAAAPEIHAM